MNRHICTKDDPWKPSMGKAVHPDAVEIDGTRDDYAKCECPNCGHVWYEELPE